jgi:hypothetical protein
LGALVHDVDVHVARPTSLTILGGQTAVADRVVDALLTF